MELAQLAASNSVAVSGISFTNSVLRTGGLFSGLVVYEGVVCDSVDSLDGGLTTGGVDDGLILEAFYLFSGVAVSERDNTEHDDGRSHRRQFQQRVYAEDHSETLVRSQP